MERVLLANYTMQMDNLTISHSPDLTTIGKWQGTKTPEFKSIIIDSSMNLVSLDPDFITSSKRTLNFLRISATPKLIWHKSTTFLNYLQSMPSFKNMTLDNTGLSYIPKL